MLDIVVFIIFISIIIWGLMKCFGSAESPQSASSQDTTWNRPTQSETVRHRTGSMLKLYHYTSQEVSVTCVKNYKGTMVGRLKIPTFSHIKLLFCSFVLQGIRSGRSTIGILSGIGRSVGQKRALTQEKMQILERPILWKSLNFKATRGGVRNRDHPTLR